MSDFAVLNPTSSHNSDTVEVKLLAINISRRYSSRYVKL